VGPVDIGITRRVLRMAGETGCPVVTFYNAPGTRLDTPAKVLSGTRRLAGAAATLSGVVPQIAVVTGPCGATSALAAASADLCVMTRDAELFLSPPFLAAAAGNGKAGAGGAEGAAHAGVASVVAESDAEAVLTVIKLLALLPANNLAETATFEFETPATAFSLAPYTGRGAIEALADADSAVELFAGFGGGVTTALATVAGSVVGITATNGPETYLGRLCAARAARFARLCDSYSIPLVTVINTGGFVLSSQSDEDGAIRQAARLAATYADATCAKVAVLAGRTFGPVYSALANADLTIALEGSVTAPVEPSAAVTVLYRDEIAASDKPIEAETAARAAQYEAEQASATALLNAGLANFAVAPAALRGCVATALDILASKRLQRLPKKHGNMPL